jgi:probable HAF family extracellular repeat protein
MTRLPKFRSLPQARLTVLAFVAIAGCTDSAIVEPGLGVPEDLVAARGGTQGPTVKSTDPDSATVDTTLNVRVFGRGFDVGSRADWAFNGVVSEKVVTNSTVFVSSTELLANITIARNANIGSHDVIVTTSTGKPGIGTELFVVTMKTTDLGTLGGTTSRANKINSSGDIVGASRPAVGGERATYWKRVSAHAWTIHQLGAAPDEFQSGTGDISDAGVVAGWAYRTIDGATQHHAVRWGSVDGLAEILNGPGDGAGGINLSGQIVGSINVSGLRHGFRWENGVTTDLGTVGTGSSEAWSINSTGVIVGAARNTPQGMPGVYRAIVWRMGIITELPMLPGGTTYATANEVNDAGVIVGTSANSAGEWRAVRWVPAPAEPSGYRVEDLGFPSSIARDINNSGEIVGHYHLRSGSERAFYWSPSGKKLDLPALSGKASTYAFGINDAGEIVGFGSVSTGSREEHAIVWTGVR